MRIETKFDLGNKVWFFANGSEKSNLIRSEIINISLCRLSDIDVFIEYSMSNGCTSSIERGEHNVWSSAEEAGAHIAQKAIERMKKEDES